MLSRAKLSVLLYVYSDQCKLDYRQGEDFVNHDVDAYDVESGTDSETGQAGKS